MTALPADIAAYTVDGVVVTVSDLGLRGLIPDARDLGDQEIEMFFVSPAHAQTMLDEKSGVLFNPARPHEAIEIPDSLGLEAILAPRVPRFTIIDSARGLNATVPVRAFADDGEQDRFSIELLG